MTSQSGTETEFFFLEGKGGPLFSVLYMPDDSVRDVSPTLLVQPFGEELNKSRRMVALQSREFARRGAATLVVDLPGCGDSYGNLADASWDLWVQELEACVHWLRERFGRPVRLWGVRMGALLIVDLVRRCRSSIEGVILWQPVLDGRVIVNGLLRQARASAMLQSGSTAASAPDLRGALARGESIEVGGYVLNPTFVAALENAALRDLDADGLRISWFDVSNRNAGELSPASAKAVAALEASGLRVDATTVEGEAFWSTVEITICPRLIEATSDLVV
jgi:exosortase A-associated hydrolase 2